MPDMILMETEEKMEERVVNLSHELAKIRTGRANPKMFDDVKVEYYGVPTPISQVGQVAIPEPTQILIKPYDKSLVKEVEKDRLVREVKSARRKRKAKLPFLKLKSKSPARFSFQN